jgi:predicted NBD/HSP70 family sugar kinase
VERHCLLPEDVRAHNRGLLLRVVNEEGPLSRRDLAHRTGLSIPTVAAIVADLLIQGYVRESLGARSNLRGPRASLVGLVRDAAVVMGVDVGVRRVRIGLCDLSGLVPDVVEVPVDGTASAGDVLDAAVRAAAPLVARAGSRLSGVGVAVPGPVDAAGRRSAVSLPLGWRDVPVAEHLELALGVPATVEYNVRAMAQAEALHGLGRCVENLLYVEVGDGVGFSFAVGGVPFRQGAHGVSELGHHQVAAAGPRCGCGALGCLEAYVAEPYLRQRLWQVAPGNPVLDGALRRGLPPLEVLDLAVRAGEAAAGSVLDDVVTHVSTAIALNVNVFSPRRVALGGMLAQAPKDILTRLVSATRTRVCAVLRGTVEIEPSALGAHAGVLGAAATALDRLLYRAGGHRAGGSRLDLPSLSRPAR